MFQAIRSLLRLGPGWEPSGPMGPLVSAYLAEMTAAAPGGFDLPKVDDLSAGRALLEAAPQDQVLALRATLEALSAALRPGVWKHDRITALQGLATRLLRKSPPLGSDDLVAIFRAMPGDSTFDSYMPLGGLLRAVELRVEDAGLDAALRKELERLYRRVSRSDYAANRKFAERVGRILKGPGDLPLFQKSIWSGLLVDRIARQPSAAKDAWMALLEHAATAGGRSKPPQSWAREAAQRVTAVGTEAFAEELAHWLEALPLDPARPDPNDDLIKGLVWYAGCLEGENGAGLLGRFTERCFKKVPDIGARSVKLGNAGLYALGAMPEAGGVAELSRLNGKLRYPSARKQIEKVLLAAAERAGKTIDELQEIAVPDFGLDLRGRRSESLGGFRGEIRIAGSDQVALTWLGPDGKSRKTVPAAVKRDHGEDLKQLKRQVKEIKDNLAGQRGRLERLLLAERKWPLADWRARYLDHPLLAELCRRLIWRFEGAGRQASGIAEGERIIDQDGAPLDWLGEGTEVALWHPIHEPAERVLAWRNRLADLEITQPFKQAHREIYVLTDAERQTGIYSNRFAAHILKQHQFRSLCQQRGWRYDLQGAWDSHNVPQRLIGNHDLTVEFWVEAVESDDLSPLYVFLYVASDQVRFVNAGHQAVRLEDVPPLVFSETLRDVDLFVGVASVGNDPDWQDGGPDFRDYWWRYGFGELGESAKTRHAVLEALLPKLKIADRCELQERYLVVHGSKRTYKIHLGSANILMEPNDQYLCIVRGYDKSGGEKVRLPFEGDSVLSMIISKAFMLAADDKITDSTILSQIGR